MPVRRGDVVMALLLRLLLIASISYAAVCLLAFLFQAKLVWFPGLPPRMTPAVAGLRHRDLTLTTSDGVKLHAWLVEAAAPRGIVLFCHGNAGSIEHRIEAAAALVAMNVSVLLFDYRGYGRSEGEPTEAGTYIDAEAAYDFVASEGRFPPEQVIAWGESLGGAVALELARRRPLRALVTEAAFVSLPAAGSEHYPWLPVNWLARVRYDNLAKQREVTIPWLLLHSRADEIVPFAHAERLLAEARAARQGHADAAAVELATTGGGHNDGGFLRSPAGTRAVASFLDAVLPSRS